MRYVFLLLIFISTALSAQKINVDSLLYEAQKIENREKRANYLLKFADKIKGHNQKACLRLSEQALQLSEDNQYTQAKSYYLMGYAQRILIEDDLGLQNFRKALHISSKIENDTLKAGCLFNLGAIYKYKTNYKKALEYLFKSLEIRKEIGDPAKLGSTYASIGAIFRRYDDFQKAIKYFYDSVREYEKADWDEGRAWSNFSIGVLYNKLKNYPKAVSYLTDALEIYKSMAKENKNYFGEAVCYSQLGSVLSKQGKYEKAIEYGKKALNYRLDSEIKPVIADEYRNLGFIYFRKGNYIEAEKYLKKGLELKNEVADFNGIAYIYQYLSEIKLNQRKYDEAYNYLVAGIEIAEMRGSKSALKDFYHSLSQYYEKLGNYKKSLEMYRNYSAYQDSLFNIQAYNKLQVLELEFETEKKEQENLLLKSENQIMDLEIANTKYIRNSFIVISVLLILAASILFTKFKLKTKLNKDITKQKEQLLANNLKLEKSQNELKLANTTKDRFLSIISHDLRSPFSSLMGYTEILKDSIDELDNEDRRNIVNSLHQSIRNVFNLIEELLTWANAQSGNFKFSPQKINIREISTVNVKLFEESASFKNIKITNNIKKSITAYADFDMTNTVFRNILNNAIKFTKKSGEITLDSKKLLNETLVSISDTGIGLTQKEIDSLFVDDQSFTNKGTLNEDGSGLGLSLCKEFISKNNGKIWVESEKNVGSTFYFTLPS